jgi:hypothetical protein
MDRVNIVKIKYHSLKTLVRKQFNRLRMPEYAEAKADLSV